MIWGSLQYLGPVGMTGMVRVIEENEIDNKTHVLFHVRS